MLNEYLKESTDFVMKPSGSNHPSSDTIYQGTLIIPYIKGIYKIFRCTGNRSNVRTIFKTKHTLRGTLIKPDKLEMPSSVYTTSHVIVADVTTVKQADLLKYILRSTNIT
jgi:hypothetical protein